MKFCSEARRGESAHYPAPVTTDTTPLAGHRRARLPVIVAALVALALAAAVLSAAAWSSRYDPLRPGPVGFVGPVAGESDRLSVDPSGGFRIVGGPGTEVTLQFGVANTGPVGITIDGIVPDWSIVAGTWSEYRFVPGGLVNGEPAPERPFPARVPAHRELRLAVTVRQPDCAKGNRTDYLGPVRVRWHALGRHHVTLVQPMGNDPYLTFCDPH